MNGLLTAETKLSYGDLQHLSFTRYSQRHSQRVVPPWTSSNQAIQAVILAKLRLYARFTGCLKDEIERATTLTALEELARKSQVRLRRFDNPRFPNYHVAAHLKSVETRSLAALFAYEIYATYRLGRNSLDVAKHLGISPWSLRQHLHRLNKIARELFPHLCVPTRNYGGKYSRETYLDAKIAETAQLLKGAKSKRIPVYEAKLAELRKMKEQRDTERQHATLYKRDSSANRAAA